MVPWLVSMLEESVERAPTTEVRKLHIRSLFETRMNVFEARVAQYRAIPSAICMR